MARPPKDPNPVASTGGVANLAGNAIFTGDWNSLITDYTSLNPAVSDSATGQTMQAQGVHANNDNDIIALTIKRANNAASFGAANPFGADLQLTDSNGQNNIIFGRNGLLNPYQIYQVINDNTKTEDFSPMVVNVLAGPSGAAFQTALFTYDMIPTLLPQRGAMIGESATHGIGGTPLGYLSIEATLLDLSFSATVKANNGAAWTSAATYPTPANVGQPGAVAGTNGFAAQDHRHGFTGRFHLDGYLATPIATGGSFPKKFVRFRIANGATRTMVRLSVYAQTAPSGGATGESYGIVNGAGTLQGTAVTLAPGAVENDVAGSSSLTGGLGGTIYYVAQTASDSTGASTGVNFSLEYQMAV